MNGCAHVILSENLYSVVAILFLSGISQRQDCSPTDSDGVTPTTHRKPASGECKHSYHTES